MVNKIIFFPPKKERTWQNSSSLTRFSFWQVEIQVGAGVCRMRQNSEQRHRIATGGKENCLKIWDLHQPQQPIFRAKNVSSLLACLNLCLHTHMGSLPWVCNFRLERLLPAFTWFLCTCHRCATIGSTWGYLSGTGIWNSCLDRRRLWLVPDIIR